MASGKSLTSLCQGCGERPKVAKDLCLRCYKRRARGLPPTDPNLERLGLPDGHGHFGVLDEDDSGLLCHECGSRQPYLGNHVAMAHGMTADQYRAAHGLPRGRGLIDSRVREAYSKRSSAQLGTAAWKRLEAARDPAAASAARDLQNLPARTLESLVQRAVTIGKGTKKVQVRTCPFCGAQWCPLPGGYTRKTCRSDECLQASRDQARAARQLQLEHRTRLTPQEAARLRSACADDGLEQLIRAHLADGVAQRDLAPAIGISEAGLSRFLNGRSIPSLSRPRKDAGEGDSGAGGTR